MRYTCSGKKIHTVNTCVCYILELGTVISASTLKELAYWFMFSVAASFTLRLRFVHFI